MTIYAGTKPVLQKEIDVKAHTDIVCFASHEEREEALALFVPGARGAWRGEETAVAGTRFESHNGADCLFLAIPNQDDWLNPPKRVELYLSAGALLVLAEEGTSVIPRMQKFMQEWHGEPPVPPRVLNLFFSCLFYGDSARLQDFEEEVETLEELASRDEPPKDCILQISQARRKLLVLKRYYEAVFDLLEDLEENQNGFFTPEHLRGLHIFTNRAERLSNTVFNLREYVLQVREVYQNQMDISLNKTMKLFTVLTAIFFPLTLIAGWYGMNLRMPEYTHPYAYPMVIALSALVVLVCVLFFRKKRWF